jgi:DNA-binding response OmpR family regulator
LEAAGGQAGVNAGPYPELTPAWGTMNREAEGGERVRILVVEDERLMADAIAEGLRRESLAVDVVYDGDAALERLGVNEYDVVVLDRDLPIVSGDEVCRAVVDSGAFTRVLMLTAATAVGRRVEGLSLGADDYLGKPFAFAELVLRVRALARRGRSHSPVLTHGDEEGLLVLDSLRRRVRRDGRPVPLTAKEFGVLEALLAADGAVVSAEDLLERVWDEHADPFTNTVRVTVNRLRRKLGDPPMIETLVGAGYRIP